MTDVLLDAGPPDGADDDPSYGANPFHVFAATNGNGRHHDATDPASFAARVTATRRDLLGLIRNGIPPLEHLPASDGMLVRGKRHHLPGPKKTGKTIATEVHAVDMVLAGARVVILDRENGAALYASRLEQIIAARNLDADQQHEIGDRLRYYEFPRVGKTDEHDLVALCHDADLVVFDSQRMFLSDLGLGENDSDEYADFMAALVDPLFRAGVATLILDNAGHSDPKRGRGTTSKGDLNELLFSLEALEKFNLDTTGRLRLEITDSRFGTSGRWEMEIGGGTFGSWQRVDHDDADTYDGFRPTGLMERASIYIETSAEPPSRRTIVDAIGGKAKYARAAVDHLVREGYARGAKGQGVESVKAYREATDPLAEAGRTE